MSRQPRENLHTFPLRIREHLRAKIERAANAHRCSMNNEIRLRLEDSFNQDNVRTVTYSLGDLRDDMEYVWRRFRDRIQMLDVGEELATAVAAGEIPRAERLAKRWLEYREEVRRTGGGVS